MRIISIKKEESLPTLNGPLMMCLTIRRCLTHDGRILLENVVRTEYTAPWLTKEMAEEMWGWHSCGFQGPPPEWFMTEEMQS